MIKNLIFNKKVRLAFYGNVTLDRTLRCPKFPKENEREHTENEFEISSGGPAANASCVPSFLDHKFKTYFFGAIGKDYEGRLIKKNLRENNVNTSYIEKMKDKRIKTTQAVVIPSDEKATRTIFVSQNHNIGLKRKKSFKPNYFGFLEFDGKEFLASLDALADNPDAISVLDAGKTNTETKELAKRVTDLLCSKEFAEKYYEEQTGQEIKLNTAENIIKAYEVLEATYKNYIVITLEANGCVYKDKESNQVNLVPTIAVKPKDTTGAGDIFHGLYIYCLAKGMKREEALIFANIGASLSVGKIGGRKAIPTLKEILDIYNKDIVKIIPLNELGKIYKLGA